MNTDLLTVAVLGFLAGYIMKSIVHGWRAFSASGSFVRHMGYKVLALLGTSVYKMSYVDQMCIMMAQAAGETEEAKKIRIQYEEQFKEWKQEIVEEFIQNYPEEYRWQLEFDDWNGMMDELTHIYKENKV